LEEDGREVFQFLVNFLGLQGSSGPLPGSVLDEIAEEHNNNPIQSIYLDFFNYHLITVFHQIWRKYKYYIKFNPNFSDNYSRNIMNLLGVSRDFIEFTHLNWHKIFYHLGIIQSGIRTKEALTSIIQHYFDLHDISLEEHVRKIVEVEVEQKNQVGIKNVMLGENFILGDKVESFSNKFRVNINNLKLDEFHQFLPNTKKYRHLQELIRFLLKDPLPYDVLLGLHPDTKSTFILGKDNSSFLGWTTLININSGKSQSLNQIIIEGAS
jgi:type VI secretion protein, VC_A0111 family